MDKEIIWRKKAIGQLNALSDFLKSEWGERVALEFIDILERRVNILTSFPLAGRKLYRGKAYRKLILTQHNFLLYLIKKDKIIIIAIEDTRQKPKYTY